MARLSAKNIMSENKITKRENLCLKCEGGIIERIFKEKDDVCEVQIKKCSNKKCNYQYGIKQFSKDYINTIIQKLEK